MKTYIKQLVVHNTEVVSNHFDSPYVFSPGRKYNNTSVFQKNKYCLFAVVAILFLVYFLDSMPPYRKTTFLQFGCTDTFTPGSVRDRRSWATLFGEAPVRSTAIFHSCTCLILRYNTIPHTGLEQLYFLQADGTVLTAILDDDGEH